MKGCQFGCWTLGKASTLQNELISRRHISPYFPEASAFPSVCTVCWSLLSRSQRLPRLLSVACSAFPEPVSSFVSMSRSCEELAQQAKRGKKYKKKIEEIENRNKTVFGSSTRNPWCLPSSRMLRGFASLCCHRDDRVRDRLCIVGHKILG